MPRRSADPILSGLATGAGAPLETSHAFGALRGACGRLAVDNGFGAAYAATMINRLGEL